MKKAIPIVILLLFFACKSTSNMLDAKIEAFGEQPELLRQPYLQMVREDSVIITWKTNEISSNCFVEFFKKGKKKSSLVKGYLTLHEGNMFNEVSISGLKPETTYNYSIYSNGHLLATGEDYHFITAPDNKNTAFTFYALGDIGAPNKWSFAQEPAARITELKNKPDFGLGLDSSDGGFFNKQEQILWLQKTLNDNKGKYDWTIVFLHHNGKTCSYKKNYKHVIDFYEIFADNNVDLVLNGHAHTYERLKPYDENGNVDVSRENETRYNDLNNRFVSITIGAGGKINKNWKADPTNSKNCDDGSIVAHYEHVPSFGLISIDGNTLLFKGINSYTGQPFDTFEINK